MLWTYHAVERPELQIIIHIAGIIGRNSSQVDAFAREFLGVAVVAGTPAREFLGVAVVAGTQAK